ncbi:unnamed protein product [Effrenium voratum]|nr:unnamed protein product [Effrenium voratum]
MGQFIAELPYDIPLSTVNRQCSSSLQATANIAAFIKVGFIDVGLAGGVENMSMFPMMATIDITKLSAKILDYENAEADAGKGGLQIRTSATFRLATCCSPVPAA